jgi:hypothetical protein
MAGENTIRILRKNYTTDVPGIAWIGMVFILFLAILDFNLSFKILVSIAYVPFIFILFWRPGEPNILFFGIMMQWLTITIKVFYDLITAEDYYELFRYNQKIDEAFNLSLYGLAAFILGIYLSTRRIPNIDLNQQIRILKTYNVRRLFWFYIFYSISMGLLHVIRYKVPGLFQAYTALTWIKWGLFFFLFFLAHKKNEYKIQLYILIFLEFIMGLGAFFSEFKEILFYSIFALVALNRKYSINQLIIFSFFLTVVIYFGILWTSIKGEFRNYLTGGEYSQKVTVGKLEAINKWIDLAMAMDAEKMKNSIFPLVDRISYIDYFSACINYVPEVVPFENGTVWRDAILHIVTPRLFFPDKPIVDDADHLNKYTGLRTNYKGGTSMSLGYMGDSYIDFGPLGMAFPILVLGFIIGMIYKYLLLKSYNIVWGFILIVPMYFLVAVNGMPAIKIMGRLFTYFLAIYLFNRYLVPRIDRYFRA